MEFRPTPSRVPLCFVGFAATYPICSSLDEVKDKRTCLFIDTSILGVKYRGKGLSLFLKLNFIIDTLTAIRTEMFSLITHVFSMEIITSMKSFRH